MNVLANQHKEIMRKLVMFKFAAVYEKVLPVGLASRPANWGMPNKLREFGYSIFDGLLLSRLSD